MASRRLIRLAGLTAAFVGVEAISFAAVSATALADFAYPVVVTIWAAFMWMFAGRLLRACSNAPHDPLRAATIVAIACGVSLAALCVGIAAGILLAGR